MATRRAPARRAGKKVVNYTWSSFSQIQLAVAANTKVLLGFFFLETGFEETIVRTRGVMSVTTDQTSAREEQLGALGMIRATDRAVAAGAASIPGPFTDADDDGWFMWEPFAQLQTSDSIAPASHRIVIDSKAQRIVREGQQLAVMLENGSGTDGLLFTCHFRVLSRFRS